MIIIIIIIIIITIIIMVITVLKLQGYLGGSKCLTNWGDYKSAESSTNQIKCWFLRRGENGNTHEKTSQSRVENQ